MKSWSENYGVAENWQMWTKKFGSCRLNPGKMKNVNWLKENLKMSIKSDRYLRMST